MARERVRLANDQQVKDRSFCASTVARLVLGVFVAPLAVGPVTSEVEFTVLDIPASYNLLLGRPWYHPLGAVPSTVHQAVKIPFNGKVEVVRAGHPSKDVSTTDVEIHPALQGFQIATLTVEEDLNDALPYVNPAVIQMFERMGFPQMDT